MRTAGVTATMMLLVLAGGCSSSEKQAQAPDQPHAGEVADPAGIAQVHELLNVADPVPVLTGRVLDEDGEPITRATVHVYSGLTDWFRVATVRTDADGRFRHTMATGERLLNDRTGNWDISAGLRLETDAGADAPLHWGGIVPNEPGANVTVDLIVGADGQVEAESRTEWLFQGWPAGHPRAIFKQPPQQPMAAPDTTPDRTGTQPRAPSQ
jgi:hypothetical protein